MPVGPRLEQGPRQPAVASPAMGNASVTRSVLLSLQPAKALENPFSLTWTGQICFARNLSGEETELGLQRPVFSGTGIQCCSEVYSLQLDFSFGNTVSQSDKTKPKGTGGSEL